MSINNKKGKKKFHLAVVHVIVV